MTTREEFCSVGLLSWAMNGTTSSELGECGEVLANIIREHYPERVTAPNSTSANSVIMHFNDHPDTTFEDVERVFEKAEVAWDERV
jgi:hypothetical protein